MGKTEGEVCPKTGVDPFARHEIRHSGGCFRFNAKWPLSEFVSMPQIPAISGKLLAALGVCALIAMVALTWSSALGEWADSRPAGSFHLLSELPLGDETGQQLLREVAKLQSEIEERLQIHSSGEPI